MELIPKNYFNKRLTDFKVFLERCINKINEGSNPNNEINNICQYFNNELELVRTEVNKKSINFTEETLTTQANKVQNIIDSKNVEINELKNRLNHFLNSASSSISQSEVMNIYRRQMQEAEEKRAKVCQEAKKIYVEEILTKKEIDEKLEYINLKLNKLLEEVQIGNENVENAFNKTEYLYEMNMDYLLENINSQYQKSLKNISMQYEERENRLKEAFEEEKKSLNQIIDEVTNLNLKLEKEKQEQLERQRQISQQKEIEAAKNLPKIIWEINESDILSCPVGHFLLKQTIPLETSADNWQFLLGDYNHDGYDDLYAIKKANTGTHSTEVHILSGANHFQTFLLQTGTILHETNGTFSFCLGDYNRNGVLDLYAIKKLYTGTHRTEVHILNGLNNFQSFLLQTGIPVEENNNTFEFQVNKNADLYAIKKSITGTHSTEVHILRRSSNYQNFILQTGTSLHETNEHFTFALSTEGNVIAVKKAYTGTCSTEIHILNKLFFYKQFSLQTGTKLHETDRTWEFLVGKYKNFYSLYAIKKQTGSLTEIQVLKLPLDKTTDDCIPF